MKLSVTIPTELFEELERMRVTLHCSRSSFVAGVLRRAFEINDTNFRETLDSGDSVPVELGQSLGNDIG